MQGLCEKGRSGQSVECQPHGKARTVGQNNAEQSRGQGENGRKEANERERKRVRSLLFTLIVEEIVVPPAVPAHGVALFHVVLRQKPGTPTEASVSVSAHTASVQQQDVCRPRSRRVCAHTFVWVCETGGRAGESTHVARRPLLSGGVCEVHDISGPGLDFDPLPPKSSQP